MTGFARYPVRLPPCGVVAWQWGSLSLSPFATDSSGAKAANATARRTLPVLHLTRPTADRPPSPRSLHVTPH
jgi:hypothetical protein